MKEFGSHLREWRVARGWSQQRLADAAGTSRQMIGSYELAKNSPSLYQVAELAGALGISVIELLSGPHGGHGSTGQPFDAIPTTAEDSRSLVDSVALPYYDGIPAGGWSAGKAEIKKVLAHRVTHDGLVVVRVHGDTMYPEIRVGDLVLVDTSRKAPKSGEIVCALYRDERALRRYRVSKRRSFLVAENPNYPPIEIESPKDLTLLGVVVSLIDRDMTQPKP